MDDNDLAKPTREDPIALTRFLSLIEETIMPTPNSIDLSRTTRSDYLLRFECRFSHIAELFQENTKLMPSSPLSALAPDKELDETKDWYFSTAYRIEDKDIVPGQQDGLRRPRSQFPAPLDRLFGVFGESGPLVPMLYSVDLFVARDQALYRVVPGADYLWFEKALDADELESIAGAVVKPDNLDIRTSRTLLFVAGAPWRYMIFLGPRGYRHMMFEAGNLIGQLCGLAAQLRLKTAVSLDFYDSTLDRVLRLDGTERTTLAIVALEGDVP